MSTVVPKTRARELLPFVEALCTAQIVTFSTFSPGLSLPPAAYPVSAAPDPEYFMRRRGLPTTKPKSRNWAGIPL